MTLKEFKQLINSIPSQYDKEDIQIFGTNDMFSNLYNEVKLSKESGYVGLFIEDKIEIQ